MNHICIEIFILGHFNNENSERQKISIGMYEEGDLPEFVERITELTKCGLDIETSVERWSD